MDNPTKLALVSQVSSNLNTTQYINGSGTAVSGLNVYQIYPKKLIYPLSGFSSSPAVNSMIGAGVPYGPIQQATLMVNTNLTLDADVFVAKPFNFFYTFINLFAINRYIDIDYVDHSGNRRQVFSHNVGSDTGIDGRIIINSGSIVRGYNINKMSWSDLSFNDGIDTFAEIAVLAGQNIFLCSLNTYNCGSAVITVPNGYRGLVTELYIFYTSEIADIKMYVRDRNNNIKTIQYFPSMARFNFRYNYMGTLNYPLDPLDTVYFSCQQSNAGDRFVHANVVMTAF